MSFREMISKGFDAIMMPQGDLEMRKPDTDRGETDPFARAQEILQNPGVITSGQAAELRTLFDQISIHLQDELADQAETREMREEILNRLAQHGSENDARFVLEHISELDDIDQEQVYRDIFSRHTDALDRFMQIRIALDLLDDREALYFPASSEEGQMRDAFFSHLDIFLNTQHEESIVDRLSQERGHRTRFEQAAEAGSRVAQKIVDKMSGVVSLEERRRQQAI